VSTPTTTDPAPWVPIRRSGWPVRRMPLWGLLVVLVLIGGGVLVSLSHKPSHAEQAADLTSYLHDMNSAVESCAGGVTESQQALTAVEHGASAGNLKTAVSLTSYDAANCSPANNESLADLTQYQVTESLAKFNLASCANDYVTWSFDAERAQLDMVAIMRAPDATVRAEATATLRRDLAKLNAERAVIDGILRSAEQAVSDTAPLPNLPG
jgi:hypothetical protein